MPTQHLGVMVFNYFPHHILALVVRLALVESAWSHVLGESGQFSCSLVGFQVSLFPFTIVIIGNGSCSGALVLWGLGTMNSRFSTTTSFTKTSFAGSGEGGARTTTCLQLAPLCVVVARWSKFLFIIFLDCLFSCQ
jgi:hypothetical protein